MSGFMGLRQHIRIETEQSWGGGPPASPAWVHAPLLNSAYDLKLKGAYYTPATLAAGYWRKWQVLHRKEVTGGFQALLMRGNAAKLLGMILDRDANGELKSYVLEHKTPVETKRHVGVKVNKAVIEGKAKDGEVSIRLDVIGRDESLVPGFSDPTYADEACYIFQYAEFEINGESASNVEAFRIEIDNGLIVGPSGPDLLPKYIIGGRQSVSGAATVLFDSAAYNEAVRSGTKGSFSLTLAHPEGGQIEIEAPKLSIPDAPERGNMGGLVTQEIRFEAELPDSGDQIAYSVSA